MYITHKGIKYKFVFMHNVEKIIAFPTLGVTEVTPRQSVCILKKQNEEGEYEDVAFKRSIVHPKDNFSKEKGRQLTFGRVLKDTFPKEERIIFWKEYANWGVKSPRLPLNIK